MKIKIQFLLTALLAFGLTFNSCKKGADISAASTTPDYTSEFQSQADDQQRFDSEIDAVANDANTAMESSPALNGGRIESPICDATVTKDSLTRTVTITYNGTSCDGRRTRTGVVTLSLPANVQWRDPGAVLTVTVTNLKITRIRDNKSITINGVKTITNVSGGLLRNFGPGQTITHAIASNGMSITFDNGSQRTWQIAKRRVFTYNNGDVITTTGTHMDGNDTTIAEWGTNRAGNAFESSTTQPMVISQACEWRLVSGQITHLKLAKTIVVTFGLDSNGNPTTCPAQTGTYYFEAVWTNANGKQQDVIAPY